MLCTMQNDVVKVSIKGVMPTNNGCALFLGPQDKTFIIYRPTGRSRYLYDNK